MRIYRLFVKGFGRISRKAVSARMPLCVLALGPGLTGDVFAGAPTSPENAGSEITLCVPARPSFSDDPQDALSVSVHDPIYFIAGTGKGEEVKGRFQISFKYRVFDPASSFIRRFSWLEGLHISYTQTSLWNWEQESAPFEDTRYQPGLFVQWNGVFYCDTLRLGYLHESNGQAGAESRSMDMAYIQPVWRWKGKHRVLMFYPRIALFSRGGRNNEDLADYRGYADLIARYGREDGLIIKGLYRYGSGGHHTVQADFSYPMRSVLPVRSGGYFYLQLYNGYGESMLEYNRRVGWTVRAGIALAR